MENKEKIDISKKKKEFLKKINKFNPYRQILINKEDGKILEPMSMVYYQNFFRWLIKVVLTGFFVWFPLFVWAVQPFHWLCILGDGIGVYFILDFLKDVVRIIK